MPINGIEGRGTMLWPKSIAIGCKNHIDFEIKTLQRSDKEYSAKANNEK